MRRPKALFAAAAVDGTGGGHSDVAAVIVASGGHQPLLFLLFQHLMLGNVTKLPLVLFPGIG